MRDLTSILASLEDLKAHPPQPNIAAMTEATRRALIDEARPYLTVAAPSATTAFAGVEIVAYEPGTVLLDLKTGAKTTIDDNSVVMVHRGDFITLASGKERP